MNPPEKPPGHAGEDVGDEAKVEQLNRLEEGDAPRKGVVKTKLKALVGGHRGQGGNERHRENL
jgi:hypothetical protein